MSIYIAAHSSVPAGIVMHSRHFLFGINLNIKQTQSTVLFTGNTTRFDKKNRHVDHKNMIISF